MFRNIPISTSILYEQEYNNISLILNYIKKTKVRRAFSEKKIRHRTDRILRQPHIKATAH